MQIVNKSWLIIFGLIGVGIVYLLSPILTPFLIAALLAYLFNPLVEKITHWHVPRVISVIIVFVILLLLFVVLILLFIPLVQKQIVSLFMLIPKFFSWIQVTLMPWLNEHFGIQQDFNVDLVTTTLADNWTKAGGLVTTVMRTVLNSGVALIGWLTSLVIIPVVTFYLLRDWHTILQNARNLIPRQIEPTVVKLIKECNSVLSEFFRGQLLVMLALGAIYSVGLMLIGLQIGLIIGMVSGLVSIVPYLGFIVGIITASIAAYMQFGTFSGVLLVWLVFAVGQAMESTVLTPQLVGDRIGLHPVAVIFAVLAGASLFGFFGVLLALPVAAVIMVWLRFLNQHYRHSRLYKT